MPRQLPAVVYSSSPTYAGSNHYAPAGLVPPTVKVSGIDAADRRTLVASVGNPWPYRSMAGFYCVHDYYRPTARTGYLDIANPKILGNQWRFTGPTVIPGTVSGLKLPTYFSRAGELANLALRWGAVGWDRTRPTKPSVDIARFAGELRQLPSMPFKAIGAALRSTAGAPMAVRNRAVVSALGSEYLNARFGWEPFISDVLKMLKFTHDAKQRVNNFRRLWNGETLRRRITLIDETTNSTPTTTVVTSGARAYVQHLNLGSWHGTVSKGSFTRMKVWYSAAYRSTHFMPNPYSEPGLDKIYNQLLGTRPTLATVYALTPWTWLGDWFTNMGSVMNNLFDPGLNWFAAKYAFLMCTLETGSWIEVSLANTNPTYHPILNGAPHMRAESGSVHKYRKFVSPFGVGVDMAQLTPYQVSIAAALGASRTR